MSTARLNVWVTKIGQACRIEEPFFYRDKWSKSYVHILHCDGTILEWCGTKYRDLPTDCGHLEVEVPPGCYMVCATLDAALGPPETGEKRTVEDRPETLGNHISHVAVVRVNCGDHACVTLFQPTVAECGIWWLTALEEHVESGALHVKKGTIEAIEALVKSLPRDPVTENMMALARGPKPPRDRRA